MDIAYALPIIAGIFLVSAGAFAEPLSSDDAGGACSRTARAALAACRNAVRDDYWTAVGRCLNTADADARKACIAEARQARAEGPAECQDQLDARLELCGLLGEAPYDPGFAPQSFVDPREIGRSVAPNPYFPLVPGSRWVYRSADQTNSVEVLGRVRRILGVPCTVVHDVVKEDGKTIEDTLDYFAQQLDGTVWYCGELSRGFEGGQLVTLDGTWQAGRELARPGVIMQANPRVGDVYRQEFFLGEAEDAARIVSRSASAVTPAASCDHTCLKTSDTTALEPGVVEFKFYAPNVGLILEVDPATGERSELMEYEIP